ncbi:diguanylate cyclase domain-containing protein [Erythrobacter sp. KY5]|uniref:sensor domain-containing diguanylate cyclase n=1 Tax=Erythrobacter sp. KY5 TaxID=2011159 RepID=UPI0013A705AF|nr:diguanylate cyclase [Erythrobacter sp. KY5]
MLVVSLILPGRELGTLPTLDALALDAHASNWLVANTVSPSSTSLLIACMLLAVIALVAVSSTIANRRQVRSIAREARARSETMRELLRTMRMAECIAGIGVWEYDCRAGVQHWSDGLKRLFGISADAELTPGDAETLLFANGADLVSQIRDHFDKVGPYGLTLQIYGFDGVERSLLVEACNLRGADGSVQRVVAVVRERKAGKEAVRPGLRTSCPAPVAAAEMRGTLSAVRDRGAIMRALDRLVRDARAGKHSLVMVMFDVRIASNPGEVARSVTLRELADTIAQITHGQSRPDEVIGRLGDQEFVWLLPQISENAARVHANALRRAIENQYRYGSARFSMGVAALQPGDSALSLIARADDAMNAVSHPEAIKVEVPTRVSH